MNTIPRLVDAPAGPVTVLDYPMVAAGDTQLSIDEETGLGVERYELGLAVEYTTHLLYSDFQMGAARRPQAKSF